MENLKKLVKLNKLKLIISNNGLDAVHRFDE